LNRVLVYRVASLLNQETGEVKTPSFFGTREVLKLMSLKPVEGSGIEVDESELDGNWLYHPKT
jgi:hypothetical protein